MLCCRQNILQVLLQTFSSLLEAACSCCETLLLWGVSRRRGLCGVTISLCSSQLFLSVKPCAPMDREKSSDVSRSDRELAALHLCRPAQTSSLSLHSSGCAQSIRKKSRTCRAPMTVTILLLCSSSRGIQAGFSLLSGNLT